MLKSTTKQAKQSKLLNTVWKPHAYQKKAIRFLLQNSCAGLFLDPGLGKTSITLAALNVLRSEGVATKTLIIAPLRVCYSVWPKELKKWTEFRGLTYTILHGKTKEWDLAKEYDIYLINPEGLQWLFDSKMFKKAGFNTLVVDESSKFKDSSTQRFKRLRSALHTFDRRYILTGSPAPNSLLDLFGQIYILDLGKSLGKFITKYRDTFFYPAGFKGYDWKPKPNAERTIQERIGPLVLRMDAEDYLKLPELIVNNIEVELPKDAWEIYKEMENDYVAGVDNGSIVASNAAVASGKCSQVANGGIYDADKKDYVIHEEKARAVLDLIEELGGSPCLVAYEYGHDLKRLQKVLGKEVPYIGGGVTTKRAAEIEDAWNKGQIPVLLGQPQSIAHGLNLQNAGHHVVWHSLTWNYENYDQFIRRIRRQGNEHSKVFVHHIVAKDTVDELKLFAMNRKFRTQKDLFDALNKFIRTKRYEK